MKPPLTGPIQPDGGDPLPKTDHALLASFAAFREQIRKGKELQAQPGDPVPNWDLHIQRLDELEQIMRAGRREDVPRLGELYQQFTLDYQADLAAMMACVNARMVRFFDDFSQRVEEKKFEQSSEERGQLDEILEPYQDRFREQMLGALPIVERRAIEEEDRRRREGR